MYVYITIYVCTRVNMYKSMDVYVRVCACVCTCIGKRRITNEQPQNKLPGIAASKRDALIVIAGCPRRGKL